MRFTKKKKSNGIKSSLHLIYQRQGSDVQTHLPVLADRDGARRKRRHRSLLWWAQSLVLGWILAPSLRSWHVPPGTKVSSRRPFLRGQMKEELR